MINYRCDAGRRGQGPGQSQVTWRRRTVAEYDLSVREPDAVAQQHDRLKAHPAGVARGGRGAGEKQATRPRCAQRAAGGREEKVESVLIDPLDPSPILPRNS